MTAVRMPARHFRDLQQKIHDQLRDLRPPHWEEQIAEHPWFYGALGDPNADVMFVCENPSLGGIRAGSKSPVGGRDPDFDTQWTGGPANRFRRVLCDVGLKDGGIWEPGGWHCYITNVIKQAAIAGDRKKVPQREKQHAAHQWSDILQKEFDVVQPDTVFCVGGNAHEMVKLLQLYRLNVRGTIHRIWHYSAPYHGDEVVEQKMPDGIAPYLKAGE